MVLTQISSGAGTCSETIVYGPQGVNGLPQVKVTRTGNACGAIISNGAIGVTQTTPAPAGGSAGNRNVARGPPVARQLSGAASDDTHRIAADVTEFAPAAISHLG